MKLVIGQPYIVQTGNSVEMRSQIEILKEQQIEETHTLFYRTTNEYGAYFTPELSDSFLITLFLYAMEHDYDIECEGAVSEEILYQLKECIMPVISRNITKYHMIDIVANTCNLEFDPVAVGTGLSCGVDSFYSVLKNIEHSDGSRMKLTHLCFFNAGGNGGMGGEIAEKVYHMRLEKFSEVAAKLKLHFFTCDCNINEFLQQVHIKTHTFRSLSMVLAFQKLFARYYFSSGYRVEEFGISDHDSAQGDIYYLPNLSNQNTIFVQCGAETTRQGKVNYIVNYNVVSEYLHVCLDNKNLEKVCNCSHCRKCLRTMLNLYLAGALDKYKSVFDIEYFYKNKRRILGWSLYQAFIHDADMPEIVSELKRRHEYKILDYIYFSCALIVFPAVKVVKKIAKMVIDNR